ncbi:alpha/beta fold hydrolase [Castellaniella ginsengisoli]|uniref:Alpha/beta hydrolase n=1 Tax=Castellaniella ginsengisoli TaxID=546114 RepID=A0AB39E3H7_9BURK
MAGLDIKRFLQDRIGHAGISPGAAGHATQKRKPAGATPAPAFDYRSDRAARANPPARASPFSRLQEPLHEPRTPHLRPVARSAVRRGHLGRFHRPALAPGPRPGRRPARHRRLARCRARRAGPHDGPLIVAGHSMGGRIALEMARQAPQRCRALILMNTGYQGLGEGETEKRMDLVRTAQAGGIQAIAEPWLDGMIAPRTRNDAALLGRMRAMILRSTPASFAGQIQALIERRDATELLGRLACPVLLMSGTEDRWSPLDRHAEMASRVPDAALEAIEGAGHMAPFEAPATCLSAITRWLARRRLAG